ncbi:MAG TPA: MFS transporter [Burkholderiaceae bacterium]
MTSTEIRSSAWLACIFALRMLGLFLILPVFAVYATTLTGGSDATLVGWGMGAFGLTNAFGQIPFGIASDKFGRKHVIIIGLIVFAIGAIIAAAADNIYWIIAGRFVQGAGAISAAITAMIADSTREEHRTKAMAMVGGSIGVTFAISLVIAPLLYSVIGMSGIFVLIGVLAVLSILVVAFVVPAVPMVVAKRAPFSDVLRNTELMRLNFGVFALHITQISMFMVMPSALIKYAGVPVAEHWKIYLPVVLLSFALMLPPVFIGEKRGKMKQVLLGAIVLLLLVQIGLWIVFSQAVVNGVTLVFLLLAFFIAFNILEASQPSLVSRIAPPAAKGAALGVYNTLQGLAIFCGGVLGGEMQKHLGVSSVFILGSGLTAVWLIIACSMKDLQRRGTVQASVT